MQSSNQVFYHYVCGCGCGKLSDKLEKGQYLRLINRTWMTKKCAEKQKKEPIFELSNGTVVAKSEF